MICPRHELLLKRPVDFVGTNEAAAKKGILTSSGRGGDGGSGGRGVGGSGSRVPENLKNRVLFIVFWGLTECDPR